MKNFILLIVLLVLLCLNSFAQINESHNRKLLSIDPDKMGLVDFKSGEEIQRLNELKSNLTSAQKKLSTDLVQLTDQKFLPSATSLQSHVNSMLKLNQIKLFEQGSDLREKVSEGSVYVYIFLYEGFTTYSLDGFAGEITNRDEKNNMAVAWAKVNDLENLASLNAVRTIRTVFPPITRTGDYLTEGDAIHRTSDVRSTYSEDGTGINVGVISDGVENRSEAQSGGTEDLPDDDDGLTVLTEGSGDEGTAMLEIVHDMVPGANLYFHDAGANTTEFNTAITNLVNAGCHIICDDIGWILEPFFEDGTIASHLNSVLSANDIIYVSACGNAGDSHYQGDFYALPSPNEEWHDFSEGTDTSFVDLYVNIPSGQSVTVILQWNDEFGTSANDYDLYLYSWDLDSLVAGSTVTQVGSEDPLEGFSYTATSSGGTDVYAIWVHKYSAADRNLEVYIYPTWFNYINNIDSTDAIFGHAAANGVVSVGAVDQATPTIIEYFSSIGPSTIEFPTTEIRQTPSIVGVDFVEVSGAGGFPTSFGGTSAATPHIVAILAQAWSYDLMQTADDVRQLLYDWPVELGDPGYDNIYGYGRGDALNIFDGALPVELSAFTAKVLRNSGVQLDWTTKTEVNNYGFDVQRSEIDEQNSVWKKITFIEGHGNSNSPKEYSYKDNNAQYGSYAYRLKQIDNDGSYEYSDVIEVNAGEIPNGFVLEPNYPNPFNPTTTIKFALEDEENTTLKVYDVLGNEIVTLFDGKTEAGKVYELDFDASLLPSGIYFYTLQSENHLESRKMVLLK